MGGTFSIGTLFFAGALHGLEPGHGNSFVAAYAMGERFKWRELLTLVGSMLGAQFILLSGLAFALQASYNSASGGEPAWMEQLTFFGPILVILFGCYLIWSASRKGTAKSSTDVSGVSKTEKRRRAVDTTRRAGLVGLFAGLIPCPTALIPLIHLAGPSGIAELNMGVAMTWILIYVLGMAVVLTILSAVLIFANKTFSQRITSMGLAVNPRRIAGILVVLVGVVYLLVNISGHGHMHAH